MQTRYQTLREGLLLSIGDRLSRPGYRLSKAKRQFRAKQPFGATAILVSFIVHPGVDLDITGSVAVRFDAVQDLTEKDTPTPPAAKAATFTLGSELGNLIDGRQKRWTITGAADVEPVAQAFCETLDKIGFPYLEKYSDPEAAFQALAGNTRAHSAHKPFHGSRCSAAVALAHLLKKPPQVVQELIEGNRAFLHARSDPGLARFENSVQIILNSR